MKNILHNSNATVNEVLLSLEETDQTPMHRLHKAPMTIEEMIAFFAGRFDAAGDPDDEATVFHLMQELEGIKALAKTRTQDAFHEIRALTSERFIDPSLLDGLIGDEEVGQ